VIWRSAIILFFGVSLLSAETPEDIILRKQFEHRLCDSLRDLHNQGAARYNQGDAVGCYRQFEAALLMSRDLLTYRPDLQKLIDNGLAESRQQSSWTVAAFQLHDTIESLRVALKESFDPKPKPPENLSVSPRELIGTAKKAPKAKLDSPPKANPGGLAGRVYYRGKRVPDVELIFISRDRFLPRVFISQTNADGEYQLDSLLPGTFTILLRQRVGLPVQLIPERYGEAQTSPLIMPLKPNSEAVDFYLR
jgi:hypothetical protein